MSEAAALIGDAFTYKRAADKNLMACPRQIFRLQAQHERHAMTHAMHEAQHENPQLAVTAGVLAPRLVAAWGNGEVVGALITQIWAVIRVVLEDVSVPRAHVTPLVEKELALLLRVVESPALRLMVDEQRPRQIDVAVAAFQRLNAQQHVIAGDRQRRIEPAKLLKDLAPDR